VKTIFVNLKRFDVPKEKGGICQMNDPFEWMKWIVEECVKYGLGKLDDVELVLIPSEALLCPALQTLNAFAKAETQGITIGCQGVFRQNVAKGKNFGAFSTNLPAAAAKTMGCTWAMIGHSEERRDKQEIIAEAIGEWKQHDALRSKVMTAVNQLVNQEVLRALEEGLNVLLCIGETEEERGEGSFEQQKGQIIEVLRKQLEIGLSGIETIIDKRIVIGYEPIWAIGPGKTPPGGDYISFVSECIKELGKDLFGIDLEVVYGGGLKKENAPVIAVVKTIDGGLIALTKFTGDICFEPQGLAEIISCYCEAGYKGR